MEETKEKKAINYNLQEKTIFNLLSIIEIKSLLKLLKDKKQNNGISSENLTIVIKQFFTEDDSNFIINVLTKPFFMNLDIDSKFQSYQLYLQQTLNIIAPWSPTKKAKETIKDLEFIYLEYFFLVYSEISIDKKLNGLFEKLSGAKSTVEASNEPFNSHLKKYLIFTILFLDTVSILDANIRDFDIIEYKLHLLFVLEIQDAFFYFIEYIKDKLLFLDGGQAIDLSQFLKNSKKTNFKIIQPDKMRELLSRFVSKHCQDRFKIFKQELMSMLPYRNKDSQSSLLLSNNSILSTLVASENNTKNLHRRITSDDTFKAEINFLMKTINTTPTLDSSYSKIELLNSNLIKFFDSIPTLLKQKQPVLDESKIKAVLDGLFVDQLNLEMQDLVSSITSQSLLDILRNKICPDILALYLKTLDIYMEHLILTDSIRCRRSVKVLDFRFYSAIAEGSYSQAEFYDMNSLFNSYCSVFVPIIENGNLLLGEFKLTKEKSLIIHDYAHEGSTLEKQVDFRLLFDKFFKHLYKNHLIKRNYMNWEVDYLAHSHCRRKDLSLFYALNQIERCCSIDREFVYDTPLSNHLNLMYNVVINLLMYLRK